MYDAFMDVSSRPTKWSFHWRLLQKAVEIIAFALHRFTRGRRIVINARLARRFDAVRLFDRNFPFLVHPKIFLTLSIPRTSAAMSPASLYTPKLARAVRSEEHTSELQSLMRISYAVF